MGLISGGCKVTALVLVAIFFAPGLPPHFNFVRFSLPEPLELTGLLAPNAILDRARPLESNLPITGPESIAIRNDELFTGLTDGTLVRIRVKDGKGEVTKIGTFGDNCGKTLDQPYCGRIAGVRFDSQGKLIAADVGYGIYRVDVDTGETEKLVDMSTKIEGLVPKFPDDIDIDEEGNIYWSDASTIADGQELVLEAFAGPTGRLVKYNPQTKQNTVLIPNLHFANGVQLAGDGSFVLVSEMFRARVWRYYLKGPKVGQKDIFVDNLPGLPDNIRPNGRGGFYVVLASPRTPDNYTPLEYAGDWPMARRFIVRLHYIFMQGLYQIETFFPSEVLRNWIIYAKGFGPIGDLENQPLKTIIVETDGNGKIIGSLQNEKGPITRLSELSLGKEWTYFGSPSVPYLYRMKTSELTK